MRAIWARPAQHYAAPAFVLLLQVLQSLPDPTLTDAEILEKIELGSCDQAGDVSRCASLP